MYVTALIIIVLALLITIIWVARYEKEILNAEVSVHTKDDSLKHLLEKEWQILRARAHFDGWCMLLLLD